MNFIRQFLFMQKLNFLKLFLLFVYSCDLSPVLAGYTDVLPKGVRGLYFQHVEGSVSQRYNPNNELAGYGLRQSLKFKDLEGVNPRLADLRKAIERLQDDEINLDQADIGQLALQGSGDAQIQVYGLAWGLSDSLTLIAAIPSIEANVRVDGQYTSFAGLKKVRDQVQKHTKPNGKTNPEAVGLVKILDNFPQIKAEHLQNYIVNDLGYKPIGNWHGSGLGDINFMLKYRHINTPLYRQGFTFGLELPTGRKDDPANLMDFAFGAEAVGQFVESLHDLNLYRDWWIVNLKLKGLYYWPSAKNTRLYSDPNFPLSSETSTTEYQRGAQVSGAVQTDFKILQSLRFRTALTLDKKWKDQYSGAVQNYDYSILSQNTERLRQIVTYSLFFSTVKYYQEKILPILPFEFSANIEQVIGGQNTEKYRTAYLDLLMFF